MQKTGNKIRLYFRHKHSRDNIFSSEIFDKHDGEVTFMGIPKISMEPSDIRPIKKYHNMSMILDDGDNFTVCTSDSFTESELKIIVNIILAHGMHVYDNERVTHIIHKIENILMKGSYLPDDENKIIKK